MGYTFSVHYTCLFEILAISHFDFGGTLLIKMPVPGHCLSFTFDVSNKNQHSWF